MDATTKKIAIGGAIGVLVVVAIVVGVVLTSSGEPPCEPYLRPNATEQCFMHTAKPNTHPSTRLVNMIIGSGPNLNNSLFADVTFQGYVKWASHGYYPLYLQNEGVFDANMAIIGAGDNCTTVGFFVSGPNTMARSNVAHLGGMVRPKDEHGTMFHCSVPKKWSNYELQDETLDCYHKMDTKKSCKIEVHIEKMKLGWKNSTAEPPTDTLTVPLVNPIGKQ